jgi:lysyl-tRNA synthetase class 1
VLWGFVAKYTPLASPSKDPFLDSLIDYAIAYYNDFVKLGKKYLEPTQKHIEILSEISAELSKIGDEHNSQDIQDIIYKIGMNSGYENLRLFFSDLYQILLGQTEGPRLGSFIKLHGIIETQNLIRSKINKK